MRKTLLILAAFLASCGGRETVILYENDVHCYTDGYTKFAALKDSLEGCGTEVITVSCGDFLSGGVYGNATRGECIVSYMNAVGYDVIVPGNHDFDYGVGRMQVLLDSIRGEKVCCNFKKNGEPFMYPGFAMVKRGNRKIAFVGVTTPTTLTTSLPAYFTDREGEVVYSFCADSLTERVQECVNGAKDEGADMVILLSHMGDRANPLMTSRQLIAATQGIDAVLDGHEHNVIVHDTVMNAAGKPVLLTSTGAYFKNAGLLRISGKRMETSLVKTGDIRMTCSRADSVDAALSALYDRESENHVIGTSGTDITITDRRGMVTRNCETTLGDLVTDAFRSVTESDIAFLNSGALRANLEKGDISFADIRRSLPFTDYVCKVSVKGSDIADMLEMSSRTAPRASGGFMQVSGLKYRIDTSVRTSVETDRMGVFVRVAGKRRVHGIMIQEKDGKWSPLDTCRTYTASSIDYILHGRGDGIRFMTAEDIGTDFHLAPGTVKMYIEDSLGGNIGMKYVRPLKRITFSPVPDAD